MLEYITARKYKHTKGLVRLWNSEFHSLYPIKKALFCKVILNDENINLDASFVALYDNEPVGFIFIKTWRSESGLANEAETAYISLLFVKKEMRNMGIGSDMLKLVIAELKKYYNIKTLVVGNEMNKVFSGIPSELSNNAAIFFVNKGFKQKEAVVDMIRVVRNDNIELVDTKGLTTQIATEEEKDEILKLCVNNGWSREAYLVNQYFEHGGSGRCICIGMKDGKIVAFARFNDRNQIPLNNRKLINDKHLGSINFVKVDKKYLNCGYEEIINRVTKNYLIQRNCKQIIILATKDVQFYKKLGYNAYKYYLQFELAL